MMKIKTIGMYTNSIIPNSRPIIIAVIKKIMIEGSKYKEIEFDLFCSDAKISASSESSRRLTTCSVILPPP